MPRAFKRDLGLPIIFNGNTVHFEPVSRSTGVIQLDESRDAALIAELDRLADARRKGVIRISSEVREDLLKKKAVIPPRPEQQFGKVKAFQNERVLSPQSKTPLPRSRGELGVPVAGTRSDPVIPPKPGEPVTLRPSPALVEMLEKQGKPVPPPITVKAPKERPSPKAVANKIPKSELPKPPTA